MNFPTLEWNLLKFLVGMKINILFFFLKRMTCTCTHHIISFYPPLNYLTKLNFQWKDLKVLLYKKKVLFFTYQDSLSLCYRSSSCRSSNLFCHICQNWQTNMYQTENIIKELVSYHWIKYSRATKLGSRQQFEIKYNK